MIFKKIVTTLDASQFKGREIVLNYGDFICVNCILCFSRLEKFKLQLRNKFG